jgi:hypothetical protein
VALHVEDELVLRRPDLRARELIVERPSFGRSKKPPLRPAAAFAALKASNVLAAPQEETRNLRRVRFIFCEKEEANSCASRFAARLAGQSGMGANSPLEVESSLIGRRLPSGSMPCFIAGLLFASGAPPLRA